MSLSSLFLIRDNQEFYRVIFEDDRSIDVVAKDHEASISRILTKFKDLSSTDVDNTAGSISSEKLLVTQRNGSQEAHL